jgi:hypothetical protein
VRTREDSLWLEHDDGRRVYVSRDGVRHIPAGSASGRCGVDDLVLLLRPEEEIEFRCPQCFDPEGCLRAGRRRGWLSARR